MIVVGIGAEIVSLNESDKEGVNDHEEEEATVDLRVPFTSLAAIQSAVFTSPIFHMNIDGRILRTSLGMKVSGFTPSSRCSSILKPFYSTVGEVSFVELFEDENGKPRGCGIVEFEKREHALTALDKMNGFELKGRRLVVKEVRNFFPSTIPLKLNNFMDRC